MQDSDPRGKELFWLMSRELAGGSVAMLPVFYREVFLRRVQILEPLFITDTVRKSPSHHANKSYPITPPAQYEVWAVANSTRGTWLRSVHSSHRYCKFLKWSGVNQYPIIFLDGYSIDEIQGVDKLRRMLSMRISQASSVLSNAILRISDDARRE